MVKLAGLPRKSAKSGEREHDNRVAVTLLSNMAITEDSDGARELFNQGCYGKIIHRKVALSMIEAFYLSEKGKIKIIDSKNKEYNTESFIKKATKKEPDFWTRYLVFKDIRERGYIVKTALKFGADFRVYERGVKPGQDHAKWIVYPVNETTKFTWYDFVAKNRVAHSTKKNMLIAIVDNEDDITYYEIKWVRP